MPSYVITGGRGLGYEFADQLSANPSNVVFSLVRNAKTASKLVALASDRKNLHVLEADVNDIPALKKAAEAVSSITGGTLDVLINNAAIMGSNVSEFKPLTALAGLEDSDLKNTLFKSIEVNALGPVYVTNAFISLLRAGFTKKVVIISSGIGDLDFTLESGISRSVPYSISKAAVNMVNAKYAVELKPEGFTFLAISPGFVQTTAAEENPDPSKLPQEVQVAFANMISGFQKVKPTFSTEKDYITPPESVKSVLKVIDNATVADTGAFISHFGNKTWL